VNMVGKPPTSACHGYPMGDSASTHTCTHMKTIPGLMGMGTSGFGGYGNLCGLATQVRLLSTFVRVPLCTTKYVYNVYLGETKKILPIATVQCVKGG
jgi:hypothetical protein